MNAARRSVPIPDKAAGDAERDEMFAADPTCGHCRNPIDTIEEAEAIYFTQRNAWQLAHKKSCLVDALLPPQRRSAGPAGRSMPGALRQERT